MVWVPYLRASAARRVSPVACALDEGSWTARVAAPMAGVRPLARITVVEGLDDDAAVTLRGSVMTLLAASRGDLTASAPAGVGLQLDGDAADVDLAARLFGLGSLVA
jgi:hypothetical protein